MRHGKMVQVPDAASRLQEMPELCELPQPEPLDYTSRSPLHLDSTFDHSFHLCQASFPKMALNISRDTAAISIQALALQARLFVGVLYRAACRFASSERIGPQPCDTALIAILATALLAISDSVLHNTLRRHTGVCFEHYWCCWS